MKRRILLKAAILGVSLMAAPISQEALAQTSTEWVTLFDGKNLDNFNAVGDANWRIEDGSIVADKGSGFLVTKNSYGDFQL